jgi:uncharacterized protein
MKPYQERVVEEKRELDLKIEKLRGYINAGMQGASIEEGALLTRQIETMTTYSDILDKRIEKFS